MLKILHHSDYKASTFQAYTYVEIEALIAMARIANDNIHLRILVDHEKKTITSPRQSCLEKHIKSFDMNSTSQKRCLMKGKYVNCGVLRLICNTTKEIERSIKNGNSCKLLSLSKPREKIYSEGASKGI